VGQRREHLKLLVGATVEDGLVLAQMT
jgi:hypothetical protein